MEKAKTSHNAFYIEVSERFGVETCCVYLKRNGLYFKMDLTPGDKAERARLWPEIENARKEGKRAYFSGVRVIADGKQLKL